MPEISFLAGENTRTGYLAVPEGGSGAGVLMLHAWWGLTPFFTQVCDRMAEAGFVAFAPDLHHGKTAATIEEAKQILARSDSQSVHATALAALDFLRRHPTVSSSRLGAIGFSMGAAFALDLHSDVPDAFAAVVLFYGLPDADLTHLPTPVLGHFGEEDEWEPIEQVKQIQGDNVTIHLYSGAGHWFFEEDRPEHFRPEAAALAWERTLSFLHAKVS